MTNPNQWAAVTTTGERLEEGPTMAAVRAAILAKPMYHGLDWAGVRRRFGLTFQRIAPAPPRHKAPMSEHRAARAAEKEARRGAVFAGAVEAAKVEGYQWITRESVAARCGVSVGTVSNAYGDMRALKRKVLQHACDVGISVIVAQGLADGHEIARNADPAIKQKALQSLDV